VPRAERHSPAKRVLSVLRTEVRLGSPDLPAAAEQDVLLTKHLAVDGSGKTSQQDPSSVNLLWMTPDMSAEHENHTHFTNDSNPDAAPASPLASCDCMEVIRRLCNPPVR